VTDTAPVACQVRVVAPVTDSVSSSMVEEVCHDPAARMMMTVEPDRTPTDTRLSVKETASADDYVSRFARG